MNEIIKKILKTFAISVSVFFILYVVIVGYGYIFHGESADLNFSLSEFIGITVAFILPGCLIYGFFYTLVLIMFSFFDKRILNKWFIFGFSIYTFLGIFVIKDIWLVIGFILISLAIAVVALNIQKWIKKPSL